MTVEHVKKPEEKKVSREKIKKGFEDLMKQIDDALEENELGSQ
jgi:hypothetical protein